MELLFKVVPYAWTKLREQVFLQSNFERSFTFRIVIISTTEVEEDCLREYVVNGTRLIVILHSEIEHYEQRIIQSDLKSVCLTVWVEPAHQLEASPDIRIPFSPRLLSRYPFIPIIGDVHHKSNPHEFVFNYLSVNRPTEIFAASCPHVVAPSAVATGTPFTIYPWSIIESNEASLVVHGAAKGIVKNEFTYFGPMISRAHPRRTTAVNKLSLNPNYVLTNYPSRLPDQWIAAEKSQDSIGFYCSLNSQFSHHLLIPWLTDRYVLIDNGVTENPYLAPVIPSQERFIPYEFEKLESSEYLSRLVETHISNGSEGSDGKADGRLRLKSVSQGCYNEVFDHTSAERKLAYGEISAPYGPLRGMALTEVYLLLNLFDILQELHRLLLTRISLTFKSFFYPRGLFHHWTRPYTMFRVQHADDLDRSVCNLGIVELISKSMKLRLSLSRAEKSITTSSDDKCEQWKIIEQFIYTDRCFAHDCIIFPQRVNKRLKVQLQAI
jgi:hypothetical protein